MFGVDLFKKNLIRDEDAIELFETMAWLIQRYGAPRAPKVPSPLHRSPCLTDIFLDESDQRPVFDWSQDIFAHIKMECGMDGWSIEIEQAVADNTHLQHMLFAKHWNMAAREPYRVDNFGRPVIIFEPEECGVPGAFATRVISKLSEIQLMNYAPEYGVSPIMGAMMLLCSAAYMGQGFTLLAMSEALRHALTPNSDDAPLPERIIHNGLIFSTCLGLLALNRTEEQIVATYGKLTSPQLRKKVHLACRQIEKFDTELEALKLVVNPPRHGADLHDIAAMRA
jgi:hypothetical protein